MLNIQTALQQMRVARQQGKLSNQVQFRVLRHRYGQNYLVEWEKLMALRASIAREVAPTLRHQQQVEREAFDIRFKLTESTATTGTAKLDKLPLRGFEYTPQWWKEAAKREAEAAKREREAVEV